MMALELSDKKLAVLGAGKLGGILLRAYLKKGLFSANRVTATVRHAERAAALTSELGVPVGTDNRKAVREADIVLLTVKPQTVAELLREIPLAASSVEAELTTPTGAAILAALGKRFGPPPGMTIERIGYGAGTREFDSHPNLLRVLIGKASSGANSGQI